MACLVQHSGMRSSRQDQGSAGRGGRGWGRGWNGSHCCAPRWTEGRRSAGVGYCRVLIQKALARGEPPAKRRPIEEEQLLFLALLLYDDGRRHRGKGLLERVTGAMAWGQGVGHSRHLSSG